MARRVYGSIQSTTDSEVRKEKEPAVVTPIHVEKKTHKVRKQVNPKFAKGFIIVSVLTVFAAMFVWSYYYIRYIKYDNGYGFDTPENLAVSYLHSFEGGTTTRSDVPYNNILMEYFPREARNVGYGADIAYLNEFSRYADSYGISFDNIQMVGNEPVDIADKIPMLEAGFYSVYGKTIRVQEAREMVLLATMHYTVDEKPYSQQLELTIPCVKCNSGKWYLYTGAPYGETEPVELSMREETTPSASESTAETVPEIQPRSDVDKPIPEVAPYEDAINDLRAGNVGINGQACVMPMTYNEAMQVGFEVDENDPTIQANRTLPANYLLKWFPVRFASSTYNYMTCRMDLGNASNASADISNCLVTTLYFGKPQDSTADYFDICLPGNVTIGTSYQDVCTVYGSENLLCIKGSTNEAILPAPDLTPPTVERQSYDTWVVTISGVSTNMTEEEYNEWALNYDANLQREIVAYEDYMNFLYGSAESNIVRYSETAKVYRISISEHNYIYLSFENDILVGIQWYYFDLRPYNSNQ